LSSGSSAQIDALLQAMLDRKASDLHVSSAHVPMLRIDGEMRPIPGHAPIAPEALQRLLWPVVPPRNREEFQERHDTDFAYEIAGLARFRANVFMDRKGRGGVFRVIPSKILTAEDLGLSPHILALCKLNKGLILVTGPTGSGKSTTLCAMVDYVNKNRADHIIAIDDPIEFVHENKHCLVNQREVHTHTDSFKDSLRGPRHRSIPVRSAVADSDDAVGVAARGDCADAVQEDWRRSRRCSRGAHRDLRREQPHSRGEDLSDSLDHAGR
jgi:twitching motility protein PilT